MIALDLNPPDRILRQFGWIALFGFALLGALFHFVNGWLPLWGFGALVALGALMAAFAASGFLAGIRPVYIALSLIAVPIGIVVSTVLIGLIYYGLFTPVGLLFRLLGRDKLERRIDRSAPSYWVERTAPRPPASYLKLY